MLLDVVIAACAALASVGVVMAGFRLTGRKAPRNLLMALAAVAIVGVTATLRYQWASNTEQLLPPEMVVIERLTFSNLIEPWSVVHPVTSRLVVVDRASLRRHAAHPGFSMVDVLLVQRDADTLVARHLIDCRNRRDAVMPADADLTADDLPGDLRWGGDAPAALYDVACQP
ncbi:hypothetical protein [Caenispirillum bisanense]|uniref:hypothetical protein n=1 Tax=Caenispirillum bisanense TaxID=414052 RepID=UPI0031CF35EC